MVNDGVVEEYDVGGGVVGGVGAVLAVGTRDEEAAPCGAVGCLCGTHDEVQEDRMQFFHRADQDDEVQEVILAVCLTPGI